MCTLVIYNIGPESLVGPVNFTKLGICLLCLIQAFDSVFCRFICICIMFGHYPFLK